MIRGMLSPTVRPYARLRSLARIVAGLVISAWLVACSASNRFAVRVEKALAADSQDWDARVSAKILECRAKNLPTPQERADCVEPERTTDAMVVGPVTVATVAILRAYWLASANGDIDPADFARLLDDLRNAVADLPPDTFTRLRETVLSQ